MKHNIGRILNKANRKNVSSRVHEDDDCCCCSTSPTYSEKKFLASDGESGNSFGGSCSMTDDLVVFGAYGADAAYLFSLDGTELTKLEPEDDGEINDLFGVTVSMDEKVVVGSNGNNLRVFTRDGTYERSITCDDCTSFGKTVATLGNKILTKENNKLFVYTTDGNLLKEIDEVTIIHDVALSVEYIVFTTSTKTVVYSNSEPDFPLVREIEQGGNGVATAGDMLVIGDLYANTSGSAWLYNIDGTLIKELEHDATAGPSFTCSIAITDDKIIIGAYLDDEAGENAGSVFIYSAIDGEFIEKVVAPDAQEGDWFGGSVCSNESYYMVGAFGYDSYTGAAYLFNLPL
eukprot:CAMPEP_0178951962 /NCGR_PEP_ID=MMETSP0789-20121207/7528_1 /TAXON_ID=3005 /ORGANISM="Rhizosolenia setigera, Strain CCMP 1694" /LENGTH=345 /DNA_ID=CAMNT_0020632915 /DNA_START=449 /DNA_END=1486 /DNA_ORIENTATION=-